LFGSNSTSTSTSLSRLEIVAKNRPEDREPADMVAEAEARKLFSVDYDVVLLYRSVVFSGPMITGRGY